MEIKTTEQINGYIKALIDKSGYFIEKLAGWDTRWVRVDDILKELRNPEVNEMEDFEEAYNYLADKLNKIIDALTKNSSETSSQSYNKGLKTTKPKKVSSSKL